MKLEPKEGAPGVFELSLGGPGQREILAMRGAYREKLVVQASSDPDLDPKEISERDMMLAEYYDNPVEVDEDDLIDIVATLGEFASETAVDVSRLTSSTPTPNFRNDDISQRIRLGKEADRLVAAIGVELEAHQIVADALKGIDAKEPVRELNWGSLPQEDQ